MDRYKPAIGQELDETTGFLKQDTASQTEVSQIKNVKVRESMLEEYR